MGYGTGATLKATSDAYNDGIKHNELLKRSEQERELAGKREDRAQAQEGREQERFGMQRELYQRQTNLLNDQDARTKFERDLNLGVATLRTTAGQVFQPLVDLYNTQMPDGGRINTMVRNPDGTFDIEYDWNGTRVPMKGKSLDDVGAFFLSQSDPAGFLNMQRETAAKAAEQAAAERLERLKASLRDKPTPKEYADGYATFSEIYDKSFTAGELAGGGPLPGAPPREEWVRNKMIEAGFTIGGGGGGGAIPGAGEPNPERQKAMGALTDAFSSPQRWRETMRAGGLPVEDLANDPAGGAMWQEVEDGFAGDEEKLLRHVKAAAARLGIADITDEEALAIVRNREVAPYGPLKPPAPAPSPTAAIPADPSQPAAAPEQAGAVPAQPYTPQAGQGWRQLMEWRERNQAKRGAYMENYSALGQQGAVPPPQQGVIEAPQGVTQAAPPDYYQRAYGR